MTIETVATEAGLRFSPLRAEHYDFAIPGARWDRPAVVALRNLLEPGGAAREGLAARGFNTPGAGPVASPEGSR